MECEAAEVEATAHRQARMEAAEAAGMMAVVGMVGASEAEADLEAAALGAVVTA